MVKGDRVKISGTKYTGTVISTTSSHSSKEPFAPAGAVMYVVVKRDDGIEMEYTVNELRKI